jgi:hypothetical protein
MVEVEHVLLGQTPGMVFAQNKDVIEKLTRTLPMKRSQIPFAWGA